MGRYAANLGRPMPLETPLSANLPTSEGQLNVGCWLVISNNSDDGTRTRDAGNMLGQRGHRGSLSLKGTWSIIQENTYTVD